MAGHDPSTMLLPDVLDASVALVVEGYLALGADWWTALETAQMAGETPPPDHKPVEKTEAQQAAENQATMTSLMAGLSGTSFKGSSG